MNDSIEKAARLNKEQKYKAALKLLNKLKSHSKDSLLLLAEVNNNLGNYQQAILAAESVLESFKQTSELTVLDEAQLQLFIGIAYKHQEKYLKAIKHLEKSIMLCDSVDNADAFNNLAALYLMKRKLIAFEELAIKLLKWDGYHLTTRLLMLDSAVLQQNTLMLAQRLKAILPYVKELTPTGFGKVGQYLLSLKMNEELMVLIDSYEQQKPENGIGLRAKLAYDQQDYTQVLTLLSDSLLQHIDSAALYYLRGDAHHKQKDFELAYQDYNKAVKLKTQQIKQSKLPSLIDKPLKLGINFSQAALDNREQDLLPEQYHELMSSLTFVIGFPRSGTTLIDNILDTQQDILVFSEAGVFKVVLEAFQEKYGHYKDISKLTAADIIYLRTLYFNTIEDMGFSLADYLHIVEKNPHYVQCIPLMKLLFPQAKFIHCVRHPLDVTLSCFQLDFIDSVENRQLLTLNSIVTQYVKAHTVINRFSEQLDLNLLTLRYEDLVVNFEHTACKVFEFLAIDVDDSYKYFDKHADAKYVTSASKGQTNKQLYKNAMNRWQAYEAYIRPVVGKLEPLLKELDYSY